MRKYASKDSLLELIEEIGPIKKGFDLISDHVVITDENANILFANKGVRENTGFSSDDTTGKNPADLWGGNMNKEFYQKMWRTIKAEKRPFVGEVQNQKKDGTMYWQELHVYPILGQDGNIKFFVGIEPNITEKKKQDKFREEFISVIGHQLRNPLAAINALMQSFLGSKKLSKKEKVILETAYKENKDLSNFVADLLVLSRVGSGKLKSEKFDAKEEIEKIVNEVRSKNPDVYISFVPDGNKFPVKTIKSLALQVFSNLIYNSAEYSSGKAEISLKKENDSYLLSCSNNGPAIKNEDQPKIFSKFFRTEFAQQKKSGGTGLGLYIVKAIADDFHWDIWFKSTEGQGTTFFVRMNRLVPK